MPILISGRVDFRAKYITKDKESHLIIIKGSIHQDDTEVIKVYTSNKGTSNGMK